MGEPGIFNEDIFYKPSDAVDDQLHLSATVSLERGQQESGVCITYDGSRKRYLAGSVAACV